MGHHITALIGKAPVNKESAEKYDLPLFEENGFVIVALCRTHTDYWDEKLGYGYKKKSEIIMDTECTHFFAKELGLTKFAIINTDYFGGIGEQIAAVYENAEQILPPTKDGINSALKTLGVKKRLFHDYFDSINLRKYRDWDDYFEQY
jgi:hypothetical protein